MPTAAAISAGAGAVASLGSGILGYFGSKNAASQQTQGLQSAISALQGLYGSTSNAIQPVINLGTNAASGALSTLKNLLTPGPNMTSTLSQIPGFTFAQGLGPEGGPEHRHHVRARR